MQGKKDEGLTTIQKMLLRWSKIKPESNAFIFYDADFNRSSFSRSDIYELSSKYAAILKRQGVQKGDVICNTLPNSPARLITQYGCIMAGAITLNGQVFLTNGANFIACMKMTKCTALILNPDDSAGPSKLLPKRVDKGVDGTLSNDELPHLRHVFECRWDTKDDRKSFMEMLQDEKETYVCDSEPTDPVHIFTTSGTTGFSKMVLRNHEEMTKLCLAAREALDIKDGEIFYNDRPLGWSGGYPMMYVVTGNTRVLTDLSRGQPKEPYKFMWNLICREKSDVSFLVPYHLEKICEIYVTSASPRWRLRSVLSGGQPLKKTHLDSIGTITSSLSVTYGSTEAGTISYKRITNAAQYEDCNNGLPSPGVEIKIVNKSLKEVTSGTQGRILIRSNQVCSSYFGIEESKDSDFLSDGWFRSGDVGFINDLGEVHVICREKFGIMHGSYVIYPGWIEVLLLKCPAVQSVAVVPVPDGSLHEEICACVIRKQGENIGEDELHEFYSSFFIQKGLSEQSAFPKYYLFFTHFPTGQTGKICRHSLQKIAIQRLGLEM